jgi:hypothetical protein
VARNKPENNSIDIKPIIQRKANTSFSATDLSVPHISILLNLRAIILIKHVDIGIKMNKNGANPTYEILYLERKKPVISPSIG